MNLSFEVVAGAIGASALVSINLNERDVCLVD